MDGLDGRATGAGHSIRHIARETLRLLAERRLPPTPEHYERVWHEIEGGGPMAGSEPPPAHARTWGDLLSQALRIGILPQLQHYPELQSEARALAGEAAALGAASAEPAEIARYAGKLRHFWEALTAADVDTDHIREGLVRILKILVGNVSELVGDDSWLRGQLEIIETMAGGALDVATVQDIEKRLREIAFQQGVLKQSLDQAKDAMRTLVTTFVERLASLADGTDQYHGRLEQHAQRIAKAGSLSELSALVVDVMEDTRGVQSAIGRSRDELLVAQKTVHEHEARARALESELTSLSSRLNEDFLTQVLNRRGLARAYTSESARADRAERPMCIALLDIDHFKKLNDRLGHAAGDDALVHLARVVRESIRPSDSLGRWGGEEFVILLPETAGPEAVKAMQRVQRALTRRYFLHNHERILITFSAGVAQRRHGEAQDALIERADRALYEAKKAGRNRVRLDGGSVTDDEGAVAPASAATRADRVPERTG